MEHTRPPHVPDHTAATQAQAAPPAPSGNEAFQHRVYAMARNLTFEGAPCAVIPLPIIISIITSMIQAIISCFNPAPSPTPAKEVQDYVRSKYNEATKTYDEHLMRRMLYQARKSGRRQDPAVSLTTEQQTAMAFEALEQARLGAQETEIAIMHVAANED